MSAANGVLSLKGGSWPYTSAGLGRVERSADGVKFEQVCRGAQAYTNSILVDSLGRIVRIEQHTGESANSIQHYNLLSEQGIVFGMESLVKRVIGLP